MKYLSILLRREVITFLLIVLIINSINIAHHVPRSTKNINSTKSSYQTQKTTQIKPTPTSASATPAPTSSTPATSTPTSASATPAPTSSTPATDSAQYLYCIASDSGKDSLDNSYEATSLWLTGEVQSVTNQVTSNSISATAGIDYLNSYISTVNQNYTASYQTYLAGRQQDDCSVDVSAPVNIPQCSYDTLSLCIENITNNNNAWANLVNEM